MHSTTRRICLNAVGIALFVVLSLCLQIPVFENYYLCLGYVVMAVYSYLFGTRSGTLVGCLGVIVYCFLTNNLRGMAGWTLGNLVIGLYLGIACRLIKIISSKGYVQFLIFAITVILSTAIGILGLKSLTEVVLYAQPFWSRVVKNSYAFTADVVVLLLSFPLCKIIESVDNKKFS